MITTERIQVQGERRNKKHWAMSRFEYETFHSTIQCRPSANPEARINQLKV